MKAWLKEHPDRKSRKYQFGLDLAEYALKICASNGKCPICLAYEWLYSELKKTEFHCGGDVGRQMRQFAEPEKGNADSSAIGP